SLLRVNYVVAVVVCARVEAVNVRPTLPAADLLDLDDECAFDDGLLRELIALGRLPRARSQKFGPRPSRLHDLSRVRADVLHLAEAATVEAERAQPEANLCGLLVVGERGRVLSRAAQVFVVVREVAEVRRIARQAQTDDALL